ncbi:MAG: AtpZ/AtpI family protein [Deltaproteobacteria bacterium]|nr:MAG: AtpZ/AtpI family protein [Deltaproteobacteria bacterium]
METKQSGEGEDASQSYRRAAPYLDASWQLAGSLALWTLIGWFLDGKLGTGPWLLVTGSLLGIGLGFYLFFRVIAAIGKRKAP